MSPIDNQMARYRVTKFGVYTHWIHKFFSSKKEILIELLSSTIDFNNREDMLLQYVTNLNIQTSKEKNTQNLSF